MCLNICPYTNQGLFMYKSARIQGKNIFTPFSQPLRLQGFTVSIEHKISLFF